MVDWTKYEVKCGDCGRSLMRRLYRPKDLKRIQTFFCDHRCKAAWQIRQHPVSDEWLRQKYEVEKMDTSQIAAIVGRDPKSVWTWLQHAGIKTRSRGHGVPDRLFKRGHQLNIGRKTSAETRRRISVSNIGKTKKPKGERHHWAGVTGPDHPSWKGGLTPERAQFYASNAWKIACVAVWRRADAKCERCGLDSRTIPSKSRRFHVHHIVSFQVRELRAAVSNLALLCAPCHRFVHGKKNIAREFLI